MKIWTEAEDAQEKISLLESPLEKILKRAEGKISGEIIRVELPAIITYDGKKISISEYLGDALYYVEKGGIKVFRILGGKVVEVKETPEGEPRKVYTIEIPKKIQEVEAVRKIVGKDSEIIKLLKCLVYARKIDSLLKEILRDARERSKGILQGVVCVEIPVRLVYEKDVIRIIPDSKGTVYEVGGGDWSRKYVIVGGFPLKLGKVGSRSGKPPEWMEKYPELIKTIYAK